MNNKTIISSKEYNISQDKIDVNALSIIQRLQQSNFVAYIVGGGIRDLLLNKPPKDYDIVTDAPPEVIKKIFKRRAIIIGRRFKIVHIMFERIRIDNNNNKIIDRNVIEVSTFRSTKISKQDTSIHGKILFDNNYGTFHEDAYRRDFTINALYYDPINEVIVDFHNGINDIKNKIIKMIGNPEKRIVEDPVRILRAIRLSSKLDCSIDTNIISCIDNYKHLIINEPTRRLYEEMLKFLLSGHSLCAIQKIQQFNLPKIIFPLFRKIIFAEKSIASHLLSSTDLRIQQNQDVSVIFMLACLLWDLVHTNYLNVSGDNRYQNLLNAISDVRQFAYECGITKVIFGQIQIIWQLQYNLENPLPKKIAIITNNNKFRQAWRLFKLRFDFNQINPDLYSLWNKYLNTENPDEKKLITSEFKHFVFKKNKVKNYNR